MSQHFRDPLLDLLEGLPDLQEKYISRRNHNLSLYGLSSADKDSHVFADCCNEAFGYTVVDPKQVLRVKKESLLLKQNRESHRAKIEELPCGLNCEICADILGLDRDEMEVQERLKWKKILADSLSAF